MGVFGHDLTDPALYENGFPHRVFTGIRRDCPVAWHAPDRPGPVTDGFWSVAGHPEVTEVLARAEVHAPDPAALASFDDDLFGAAVLALARSPRLWDGVVEAGSWDPRAADELARWLSPVAALSCVAVEELTLGRHRIDPGHRVVCWLASANRDERVFGRDAMDLRLDRDPNPHLAFLPRPEAREAFAERLDALLAERPVLRLDGEPEWVPDPTRTALRTLPVTFLART